MRWIGQHIWDLTSRFRNDVYLEGLAETAETRGLVVDANGKVSINPLSGDEHATHIYENVRNDEGSTIPVGTPVYSKGEVGGSERILVGIADASDPAKMPAIGITNTELTTTGDTKDGLITLVGVYNTNLSGFSGVSENDIVYVASGGGLTITKPTGVNLIQNIGIVLKTNGPGTIIQGLAVTCIGRTNDVPTPLYIDHTNQRLGIGTTSPSEKLHVKGGNIRIDSSNSNGQNLQFRNNGTANAIFSNTYNLAGGSTSKTDFNAYVYGDNPFSIWTNNNNRLTVLGAGNVGIGTTSPLKNFEVEWLSDNTVVDSGEGLGGGAAGSGVLIQNGSFVANTYANLDFRAGTADGRIAYKYNGLNDGDFHFITDDGNNPETKLFIENNGNVGIGTTSPAYKLDVRNSSTLFYGQTDLTDSTSIFRIRANGGSSEVLEIEANGNIGIGTTTPSQKLHVIGDARIQGNLTVNGTYTQIDTDVNTTEQWLVTNDGTGPAAVINQLGTEDIFDVQDDGTSVFYVEDGGNIGIGTTSPGKRLDIRTNGSGDGITLATSTPKTFAQIVNGNSETFPYGKFSMKYGDTTPVQIIALSNELQLSGGYTTGGKITFRTGYGPSERMRLTDTGLGIGTTSPSNPLTVVGADSVGIDDYILHNDDGNTKFGFPSNDTFKIRTAGSDRLNIDSSGNVGIGTTSPTQDLTLYRDSGDTNFLISSNNGGSQIFFGDTESDNIGKIDYDHSDDSLNIVVNAAERMRIDSSGTVGVGTSSPNSTYKLHVAGKSYLSGGIQMNSGDEIDFGNSNQYITGVNDTSLTLATGGSATLTATHAGNVGIGTTSPTDTLDVAGAIRLTQNVTFSSSNAGRIYKDAGHGLTLHGVAGTSNNFAFATPSGQLMITNPVGTNNVAIVPTASSASVGIGTTSPGRKLEVDFTGSVTGAKFTRSDAAGSSLVEFANSAGVKSIIGYDAGLDGYKIGTSSATNLFVKQSGNVGIGCLLYTSPSPRDRTRSRMPSSA